MPFEGRLAVQMHSKNDVQLIAQPSILYGKRHPDYRAKQSKGNKAANKTMIMMRGGRFSYNNTASTIESKVYTWKSFVGYKKLNRDGPQSNRVPSASRHFFTMSEE
jgi:hypothetical protein